MNASHMSPACEEGIEHFLEFYPNEDEKFCPCISCLNRRRYILDDIQEHLLCDGIKKNYKTWIWHGELEKHAEGVPI